MRVLDLLSTGHPVFSFEFFPPKTEAGRDRLWTALQELEHLRPAFVSVTYGAGGSARAMTMELTTRIKKELGIEAMAHLTCVADSEELESALDELESGQIENLLALRGDPPKGEKSFTPPAGGFRYASEMISFIEERGHSFCLGGACYPEGHIECPSTYQDLHNLKLKVDAGASFLITQLFFDNRLYFDFVDRARAAGITVPIIPGIMPIDNVDQIKRFTKMCGASIPDRLMSELEKRADHPSRVHELGVAHATIQALGLIQGGAPGVHFYTLNKSTATREILTAIRMNARV